MTQSTGEKILALPMEANDADAATVRDYLIALLMNLWSDGEGFSGKQPFGNSGWEHELYEPLMTAGLVGEDARGASALIDEAILALGKK
jgi:hypothetical protein